VKNAKEGPIPQSYDVLAQLTPIILEAQSDGKIVGVSLDTLNTIRETILGDYKLKIEIKRNRRNINTPKYGYGLVIAEGENRFIVAGKNIQVTFFPNTEGPSMAGIASLYEGQFINGEWKPGRKLNGDAIMLNYHIDEEAYKNQTGSVVRIQKREVGILRVKLYRF